MSCTIPQPVPTDCRKYAKSLIEFNNLNTFNNVAHIKNEAQYHAACDRINELLKVVNNETPLDDKNLLELDMISDMVADYEEDHFPIVPRDEMDSLKMSFQTLFESCPFLNASGFAEWIGINPSLMRKYKAGISVPQGKDRDLIRRGLLHVAGKLESVNV